MVRVESDSRTRDNRSRAVAVSKSRILQLDRETLEAMCFEQPEIAIRMIRVLAGRLIDCEQRLAALGVDDLMRPVVRVLVRHAQDYLQTECDQSTPCYPPTLRSGCPLSAGRDKCQTGT